MTKRYIRKAGQTYYFSHEVVRQLDAGEIEIIDWQGNRLEPDYQGPGLNGINGTLVPATRAEGQPGAKTQP